MKHWVTKEEMGEGFQFNEEEHKINEYNSLINTYPFEKNIMRTRYLIRDIFTMEQLKELQIDIEEAIVNREE